MRRSVGEKLFDSVFDLRWCCRVIRLDHPLTETLLQLLAVFLHEFDLFPELFLFRGLFSDF